MSDWATALFDPARVAIIGASATTGKVGEVFLQNLKRDFRGEIVAIHPSAKELLGVACFPSLADAPAPVDLAVIVTPPAALSGLVADCGAAGVPVAVVITGGFAETGPAGATLQASVVAAARDKGVRIVGPNCFGVVSTSCGLNASLAVGTPRRGGVALISQSGAYGMAAYARASEEATGFSRIVALGNKADVDESDILAFLGRDPQTRVVAMLLESIVDGRRLFETLAAVARIKPVVVLKTGRHAAAKRAAASHTAALATDAAIVDAALRQAGAHVVEDGLTLLDVAAALDCQPPLQGRRVAIVTNSGGTGVELTDLLEAGGLEVPELSGSLQARLRELLPAHGSPANPVDVTTDWPRFPTMYGGAVEALMTSGEVDAVVPVLLQRSAMIPEVGAAIVDAQTRARAAGSTTPLHVCWVAPRAAEDNRVRLLEAGVPCHPWPARAARVLSALHASPAAETPPTPEASPRPPLAPGWAPAEAVFSLLADAGFPVSAFNMATDAKDACAKARAIGFPVALKAERAGLLHKSDAGAVRLHLADAGAVETAFRDFVRTLGPGPALVQKQAAAGLELMLGGRRDPAFGPVVMVGLGGVWVEALKDVALRLAPIGAGEAAAMLDELKGRQLLAGYRGAPALDIRAFAQLLADVSAWFASAEWLAEMDVNPLIANSGSFTIVDARMLIGLPLVQP
ncbi:acetate--CoA ligase family protein [Methylocystis echinoides]|uniref:Acyl-CoA synthetase n=1 Tax=Methylocystis echinoides TaxID=29468 RepID=A0A9W6LS44_9HYPH|nr:acetate--CoA ligase [Methylocystis echinoides]GLI93066.1 acyl-CoA synthetase [Methylocystis echinoides]